MMKNRISRSRRSCLGLAALAPLASLASLAPLKAWAQDDYPARPIRLVLGFPPGGPTDLVARVLAQKMAEQLGQPLVIDNKPGVGGNIGSELVAKAPADGYTLLYNTSSITIAPWVYSKVNFDPTKDFAPVLLAAEMPLVLLVNNEVPAKTLPELVARIQANPGKYNYGSSGVGAIEHLTSAQFATNFALAVSHVPYKGTPPALIDLISGQTQFMMTTLNTALPYVKDGRLRALAVTSRKRSPALPQVPTVSEAAGGTFVSSAWQGIVAPAHTPRAIVEKLNRIANASLKDPVIQQKLLEQGVNPLGGSSEQYAQYIQSELGRWQAVVKQSGARAD